MMRAEELLTDEVRKNRKIEMKIKKSAIFQTAKK